MASEWYYENDGDRQGPVSSAALKQLAASGKIRPETLVWKDGMTQWSQAKSLKGLFAASQPNVTPEATAMPSPQRDPPSKASPGHGWHPFDLLIDTAREACPANLATTVSRFAGVAGTYLLYAASALVPVIGLLICIKTGNFRPLPAAIGISIGLLALQFVGARLLGACESAIQANGSILPSLTVPDCAFVLIVVSTLLGSLALIVLAIAETSLNPFLAALAVLVVGGFTALVAIEPTGINVTVDPNCNAGQEAVGVLTFLLKLFLRCAPIAFAAAVAYAIWGEVSLVYRILRATSEQVPFIAGVQATATASILFAAAAVPLYAYFALLVYYLTLDVISAIVSIPRKLDAIAEVGRPGNGTDG